MQRGEWVEGNHSDKLYFVGRTCKRAFTLRVRIHSLSGITVDACDTEWSVQGSFAKFSLEFQTGPIQYSIFWAL